MAVEWVEFSEQRVGGRMQEQRLRVLVVEGDDTARERVRMALAETYAVSFVSKASEALEAVRSGAPDVLVSEVNLPDGDGLRLCEQVRALPHVEHLPIMLLTDKASTRDKVAGFEAGADDYVVKPLDPRLFPARILLLSRIKRLERPNNTTRYTA